MTFFDDQDLELKCPTCGKPVTQKVKWFKEDGHVCPHGCGTTFKTEDLRRKINEASRQVHEFERELLKRLTLKI
jgi:uncharacterized Zn finger protein (UPF0148 family)